MLTTLKLGFALALLQIPSASVLGEDPPSSTPKDSSTPQNFLSHYVSNCAETEKAFYQRLIETGGHEDLLRSIRVLFSREDVQKTFTLQEKDDVKDFADGYRKTLGFDKTFGEGTQSRRLLIFHPQMVSWPGSQYFTIILANARYDVLSWRTAGGEPIMTGAELAADGKDWKLTITFRQRRSPDPLDATYRVSADRIDLYHNPEIDPPHQEKPALEK